MYAWTLAEQIDFDSKGRVETTGPWGERIFVYHDTRTAVLEYQHLRDNLDADETGWLTEDKDGNPIVVILDKKTIWPVVWNHFLNRWKVLSTNALGRW